MARAFIRAAFPVALVAFALFAIALLPSVNWADDASDLDGDQVADEVVTEPEPPGASPGEVAIHSGVDGSEIARISGVQAYDEFGRAVATIGDVNGDGRNDVLVGAPSKEAGEAYIFYGPPVRGGSSTFDASWADVVLVSPYDDDYAFGEAVAPLYDFDEDGLPDVRVRASVDLAGGEVGSRTFFFSGLTGELIGIVFGELSDWMWDNLLGDLNNDGVVDAADVELLQSRLGVQGELTAIDGDLNGDGVIDNLDVDLLNNLFGISLLTGIFEQTTTCQFILESGDCTHYYTCGPNNVPVWWATFCRTSAETGAPLAYDTSGQSAAGGEEGGGGGGEAMLGGGCPPALSASEISSPHRRFSRPMMAS